VTTKIDFLAELPIFQNLTPDQLDKLAEISQEYEFDEGAVIAYQRDVADSLYIVRNGRLYAQTLDKQGVVRSSQQYFPSDYFKESWLFHPHTHDATVTAASDGQMLVIKGQDFLKFLVANPRVLPNLEPEDDSDEGYGLSQSGWEEAQKVRGRTDRKSSAVNLLPDELVEYQARRSKWYLLVQLFWPLLGLFTVPTAIYILISRWGVLSPTITFLIVGFFALIFLIFVLFRLLDWMNDYFVITNKHLIHHEFDLRTFRITINKIPIKQVQSVEILKPTLIANLFKIGSARVTTAAQKGIILFDNVDSPRQVQETLNHLTSRVRALDEGEAQSVMRQSLESHFDLPPPLREYSEDDESAEPSSQSSQPTAWQRFRNRFAWRVVEGDTITYRRHFFVLIAGVWIPATIALALTIFGILLIQYTDINDAILSGIVGLIVFGIFLWFIWNFEDWRNDTFQVSDRFVVDIDRKPFGFGESRKQAPIANIQNVNADRPGLLPTIFNYGYVYMDTAGVDTDITFEQVPHPSQIQADIFQKLEQHEQKQRRQRGSDRREEYAVLLDVWRQAVEQDRIPQRTPPPGEFDGDSNPGD
jgi:membrane protein YdbS with pleckstrin-like domain